MVLVGLVMVDFLKGLMVLDEEVDPEEVQENLMVLRWTTAYYHLMIQGVWP